MNSDAHCLFCRIAKKEIPSKIVFEDDLILAFEDIKPKAPVHILIIPKKHIGRISELKQEDSPLAGKVVMAAKQIASKKGLDGGGYRIVFNCDKDAGQEVFHVHAHIMGGRKFAWPPG